MKIGPIKNGLHRWYFSDNHAVIAPVKKLVTSTGVDFYKNSQQGLIDCR